MAIKKAIKTQVKLQIEAGKANPAPPVGTALGPHGINMMDFCKAFNAKTQSQSGDLIPVVVTVYKDKTFTFVTKVSPMSSLIKKTLQLAKGSAEPHKIKVGVLTMKQVHAIAKQKMADLNTDDLEMASRIVMGTVRSMGVTVAQDK